MPSLSKLRRPVRLNVLVAFSDLSGFAKTANGMSDAELFGLMSAYAEMVGDIVEEAGGVVVKFMGDAAMLVFPEEKVDAGVLALKQLQKEGDAWLAARGSASRHRIQAHFGPAVCGPFGTRCAKHLDVYGAMVNTAAMARSDGLALTPALFRKLSPATRRLCNGVEVERPCMGKRARGIPSTARNQRSSAARRQGSVREAR